METIDVTEAEALEALREALGIPASEDVWEHVPGRVWTVRQLAEKFDVSEATARRQVAEALENGSMEEGLIHSDRGHYVSAFRLKE